MSLDRLIAHLELAGFHNHRKENHSDILSEVIARDLELRCPAIGDGLRPGAQDGIAFWKNKPAIGGRLRKVDLQLTASAGNRPHDKDVRLVVENKSVITAHRNRDARYDDLSEYCQTVYEANKSAIIIGTVLVGMAPRVLNIPDQVKRHFKGRTKEFEQTIIPRLSRGDLALWDEFSFAISENSVVDPYNTIARMRRLPTRNISETHLCGFDFVLLIPVYIDNVNPPRFLDESESGIDVGTEYQRMLDTICLAYTARWSIERLAIT